MSEILEIGAEDGTLITLEKDSSEDVDVDVEEIIEESDPFVEKK